jgi:hypothetical protein
MAGYWSGGDSPSSDVSDMGTTQRSEPQASSR